MKGQPLSVHGTSLCAADFRIFFHMKTDNCTQATVDHPSITKAAGRLFLSTVISKQLNAAPYLRHKPLQGRDRASPAISRVH